MKLHILSDLHLGVSGMDCPPTDADVVILAGDIARARHAVPWALGFNKPLLFVLGNHEFYGGSLSGVPADFTRGFAGTQARLLDDDEIVIGGVRFLGSTLWSDFGAVGADRIEAAKAEAAGIIYDFSRIRLTEDDDARFTPDHAVALCRRSARWLAAALARPFDGPTVVITHHAPTLHSIHPRFAGSLLNGCFVSDLESLVEASGAEVWIHGHTHDGFDYQVGRTRVLCNPRGYVKDGQMENPSFDPAMVITVGA